MSEHHNYTIILESIVGSKAYGLNTPSSDIDTKKIAIPELKHYFGCSSTWTGTSNKHVTDNVHYETTIYEITRFVNQCINASPESLDILFSPYVKPTHSIGFQLLSIRDSFLCKKCRHSYSGFAVSQYHKVVKHPDHPQAGKWASHTYRLMNMAAEIGIKGKIHVDRSDIDKDFLLEIKTNWNSLMVTRLTEFKDRMDKELDYIYAESELPYAPDKEQIDDWLVTHLRRFFAN